jgi:hypothetical protein
MWPYTNEEAGWLTPSAQPERPNCGSANDNEPARHVPARPAPDTPTPTRKTDR